MNWLDILFAIPLLYGLIQGLRRGIVKEVLMLLAVVLGVYVAKFFSAPMSLFVQEVLGASEKVAAPLSYILVVVVFAGGLYVLAWMLTNILKAIKLGTVNRVAGGLFGLLKWALIISVVLHFFMIVDRYVPVREKPSVQESVLYEPLEGVMDKLLPFLNIKDYLSTLGK